MEKYASELHRFIDEWLRANETNWETLRKDAGVSAPVGTDIRRGSTPRPDTLRRLSEAMGVPIRVLYELSGYVERGELDPVQVPVPDDYEVRSFFTDNAWDDFTADEKEIVRLGMRMALRSKSSRT
jgi:hypothetical protein